MSDPLSEIIIRSLDEELHDFDQVVDRSVDVKQDILNKTRSALGKVDLDNFDPKDTKAVAAFTQLAAAALKAVDAQEATAMRRINAKVKLQDSRRADNTSELVTEMFLKMQKGVYEGNELSPDTFNTEQQAIDERFLHDGIAPIDEGELRENPDDLS